MHSIAKQFENVTQVLLLGIGGLSFDLLKQFAQQGIMPNMARILPGLARAELRQPFFTSPNASWATLETGCDSFQHGLLDDFLLDHPRRRLVRSHIEETLKLPGRPADLKALENGLACLTDFLLKRFAEVHSELAANKQRLVLLKLTAFDPLFLHYCHLLGIDDSTGGRRSWIAATQRVFHVLDEQLASVFDLAASDRTAIMLASPYGFAPFREKINLNELLRRNCLLYVAEGRSRFHYAFSRFCGKQKKRFGLGGSMEQQLSGLLPIDWRRTRAVSLHGDNAAFVYLNTPARFGRGPLATHRQQEEAMAEVRAALKNAEHPLSGERLFQEAFSTVERFGIDPLEKRWPEIIGIPARGYQVRQRLDRARQLARPDASITGSRTGEGFLCWQAPGVEGGEYGTLDLSNVMRIIEAEGNVPGFSKHL